MTSITTGTSKSRFKTKAQVLIELQSLQARVTDIDQMLHDLKELSDSHQGLDSESIVQLVVDIGTHVKMVRNGLLFLLKGVLLEKQMAVLVSVQDQMYPTLDISVRFFGIDWLHIFRVSYNLTQCLNLMTDTLVKGTSTSFSDVLLPRYY